MARNEVVYAMLLADADGTVVETLAEPGQVVAAGQTVVKLAHAGPREATVNLPETVRPAIGSPAQASALRRRHAAAPARLRQLSDAADPATRTYEARYVLEGEAARAPLGATVTVRLADQPRPTQAAEVPIGALSRRRQGDRRLGPRSGSTSAVSFRAVQVRRLGAETADRRRRSARASAIVALGAHLLHEGERVRVAEQTVGRPMTGFNLSALAVRERAVTLFLIIADRARRRSSPSSSSAAPRIRPSPSRC